MNLRKLSINFIIPAFTLAVVIAQSACSGLPFAKPTPTMTSYPTIRPVKPTRTPTFSPTSTALPSATPTITPTPTLLPPLDDFSQAWLYSSGPIPGWDFSLTILLPKPIQGEYNALVGNEQPKLFTCRPLTEYAHPDRLYCIGRIPAADKQVDYSIVEKNTGQEVFKGNVYAPIK